MQLDELAAAPEPRFVREGWVDLTGEWAFRYDDENRGLAERWSSRPEVLDRTIRVPYPPESELSGINDKGYHTICWYARSFTDPRVVMTDRLLLHFGAVDYHAIVWVDGQWVGEHRGGHTPFVFDITDALAAGPEHELAIRVYDDPHDCEQPRGKQDWQLHPHRIWYHRTTGVWQPVWLETTPANRILDIRWTFHRDRWTLGYEITLAATPEPEDELAVAIEFEGLPLVDFRWQPMTRISAGEIRLAAGRNQMTSRALLWSPEIPTLLPATVTLTTSAGADQVHTYLGLRTIELDGRVFRLNGEPIFLRMVLEQGYWPESMLAAPGPDHLKTEVELILALGFNGARIHQKVEDPRFLYWADRLGLLLWGEMAAAFTDSETALDRAAAEFREAMLRDRSHPSIIAWVPFNESWGVSDIGSSEWLREAVRAAYHTAHRIDGTRPVIGNDGWENTAGDLLTIHDYNWEPALLAARYADEAALARSLATVFPNNRYLSLEGFSVANKPVMVTEYGGVSFVPDQGDEWYGYGMVRTADEFANQYAALTRALDSSTLLAGICYTQLTDTEQETNGLLTADRQPKLPMELLRAITLGPRFAI